MIGIKEIMEYREWLQTHVKMCVELLYGHQLVPDTEVAEIDWPKLSPDTGRYTVKVTIGEYRGNWVFLDLDLLEISDAKEFIHEYNKRQRVHQLRMRRAALVAKLNDINREATTYKKALETIPSEVDKCSTLLNQCEAELKQLIGEEQ